MVTAFVPLGVLLSGGLESSAIVAYVRRLTSGRIRTFSIGFDRPEYDELAYARQIADHAGARQPRRGPRLGFAGGYVQAMWLMLQPDQSDDYVIATGATHSVGELVEVAFGHAGLGWKKHVKMDPAFLRPAEVDLLIGDSSKAEAARMDAEGQLRGVIRMMVDADVARHSRVPRTPRGAEIRG